MPAEPAQPVPDGAISTLPEGASPLPAGEAVRVAGSTAPTGEGGDSPERAIEDFGDSRRWRLETALAAFGSPTTRACDGLLCSVTWRQFGLTMSFYGVGSREGQLVRATGTSPRWRSATGLRVGDSVDRLRDLYASAGPPVAGWWQLVQAPGGEAARLLQEPRLMARVESGRVTALELNA